MRNFLLVGLLIVAQLTNGQDIVKENLGPKINTPYADTKPLISPDGKTLYFARQYYPENINGEKDAQDIYYSILVDGEWSQSVNFGAPLNDAYPNGISSITPDGNSVLVLNAYSEDNVKNGVSIAHRDSTSWTKPQMLNIRDFYNRSGFADYYLSNNEQEMLLAIQRDDSFGDQDLYICFRINENTWTEPVNLGPIVNSTMAEFSPFLAADNKTLFFASEGHGSYGSSDIFYTKRLDDTWQNWTDPINLGPEVNTASFEAYYSIPASGEYAYFVSTAESISESKDIFKITIPYRFRPEAVLLVAGHVIDKSTHDPIAAEVVYHAVENIEDKGVAQSDSQDGAFKIVLPHGYSYRYYAEAAGYFGIPLVIDEVNSNEYHEIESNLYMVPIEEGSNIPLFDIYFKDKDSKLLKESAFELQRLLKAFRNNSDFRIKISAFTNEMSSGQENLELSVERALSIRQYFINNEIPADRLETEGLGNTKSFNDSELINLNKGINANNRIEITILPLTQAKGPQSTTSGPKVDIQDNE